MASNERTPLLAVVQIAPSRQRYPHQPLRRFCTYLLSAVLLFAVALFLTVLFIVPDCEHLHRHGKSGPCLPAKHPFFRPHAYTPTRGDELNYGDLLDILASTPNEEKVEEWSRYYTSGPHLAGKNLSQAIWTKDKWQEFGISNTHIVSYDVYVNYPLGHRLALLEKEGSKDEAVASKTKDWKVKFEASLEEDVLEEDPTSGLKDRIPTFHGYSASGNVTAPYVFCNYGTYHDFEDLRKANVTLKGKIALIKYSHVFRGLKVKRAQELGMVGAVIYSDPGDDGEMTEKNGYKPYPEGPARQPSSVQRGSTQFLTPGDPTTPGYPSKPGAPRQPANHSTPSIPSLPISYQDALPLLRALNGYGPEASSFNEYWQTGGLGHKGVDYNIGPTPDDLVLNLVNQQEYVTTPMWNVIGVINGTIPHEVVILGNHRDAWVAGGAGDPNSGSAVFNEVIRSFGTALAQGWKPLRTIVLASWDGEEYGLIGSTEWVEEFIPWLSKTGVAYLNVDVGAVGPNFEVHAAPLLDQALIETTKLVISPNQTKVGQTVYDVWSKRISVIGSGSDFTAFQDFAGIPSIDMSFGFSKNSPIYHYHSNYDSFAWMSRFGDVGFHYHVTMARIWALLAARLVDKPILPLNATDYADALVGYLEHAKDKAANSTSFSASAKHNLAKAPSFKNLTSMLHKLQSAAQSLDERAADLAEEIEENPIPWWRWWERVKLYYRILKINNQYKFFERKFLYSKGLDGRNWFKHVVFAPGLWTGYAGATFPGLLESIEAEDNEALERWIKIVGHCVEHALESLKD